MKNKNLMLELLHQKLEYIENKYHEIGSIEGNEEQFEVLREKRDELMAEILRIDLEQTFDRLDLSYKDHQ